MKMAVLYCLCRSVTLKIMSRSPLSTFQQCIYASLVKIPQLVQSITQGNPILDISECRCDPEIRSRSPKSNQLFPLFQQCIYASLVKIHPLVQKKTHRNRIFDISKCSCDLENKDKVTKVSKGAKIRNRYNQVPHLTEDTNGKVLNSQ